MDDLKQKIEELKRKNPVSSKIASHYDVVGVVPGKVSFGDREYDLRTIDKATADKLAERGFPYLKKKSGSPATASSGSGSIDKGKS